MPETTGKDYLRLMPQMIISGLLSGIFIYLIFQPAWSNFVLGFLIGVQAHFYIATYESFFKPRLSRFNFFLALITGTLVYIILIIIAVFISILIITEFKAQVIISNFRNILFSEAMAYGLSFGLVLSFLFSSYSMFETLLGRHFLLKLFTGKYHKPFEEERVFMFLDLKSSTTLAEKLGHKMFLQLLNDFFYDVSVAVKATKGEIYKYVGDEAIITWKMNRVAGKPLPLECFHRIKKQIGYNREKYLKKYGLVPEYKAGLHGGKVVTGEMGYLKKEIAFMGDVLNTTARIESLCNGLGRELLVSDALLKITGSGNYRTEPLGEQALKGKAKSVRISAIHFPG